MASRSLPGRLLRGLRPALLGPLRFAFDGGYLRSALLCQAVDWRGAPLLWVTYPAIAYLEALDWRGRKVLEWGAGNSTLWWAARGAHVFSVEHDPAWVEALRPRLANYPQVQLHAAGDAADYVAGPRVAAPFDVAVIDGEDRLGCARAALELVRPQGAIVLDNSEQAWAAPISTLLAQAGYRRVDFHGFAPSVARPHCTSLFFRPECDLLSP
ncbi:MAG: class I SAM-dependent methyltransferase, partial [Terriglobales bacterium]